jgi:hypothetical protein
MGYELLMSGTRSLSNTLDEVALRRLWPTKEIINRNFEGTKMMEEAKTLRIISKAGTDLKVDKTGRQAHFQCSLANVPGRWDNADYGRVDCGRPTPSPRE